MSCFEKYNLETKDENVKIIGSMDAINLYPSIKPEKATKIIKEMILKSDAEFEGLDVVELGIYLREKMETKDIKEKKWDEILPTKESKKKKKKKLKI